MTKNMTSNDHFHYADEIHGGTDRHHRHHDLEDRIDRLQATVRRLEDQLADLRASLEEDES